MRTSRSRSLVPVLLSALLAAPLLGGCTAGIATVRLVAADKAVREARDAGADAQAPFELALAERYLGKAVEASMHSEYKVCVTLAREAETQANEALASMQGTRRLDLEGAGQDISEDATTTPAEDDSTLSESPITDDDAPPAPQPEEREDETDPADEFQLPDEEPIFDDEVDE